MSGLVKNLKELGERARARRKKRRKRISVACAAGVHELVAERSKMVDWFDRLPIHQLRAVHKAAKIQFGEEPWKHRSHDKPV